MEGLGESLLDVGRDRGVNRGGLVVSKELGNGDGLIGIILAESGSASGSQAREGRVDAVGQGAIVAVDIVVHAGETRDNVGVRGRNLRVGGATSSN